MVYENTELQSTEKKNKKCIIIFFLNEVGRHSIWYKLGLNRPGTWLVVLCEHFIYKTILIFCSIWLFTCTVRLHQTILSIFCHNIFTFFCIKEDVLRKRKKFDYSFLMNLHASGRHEHGWSVFA